MYPHSAHLCNFHQEIRRKKLPATNGLKKLPVYQENSQAYSNSNVNEEITQVQCPLTDIFYSYLPSYKRPATFIKLNLTSTSIWHRNQTYPVLLQLLKTVTEYPIGWSDFSRKKFGHFSCCARMFQDPKTQISL